MLLALAYLRPTWRALRGAILPDAGDALFALCTLKWGVHCLHVGLAGFWNATFFYPHRWVTTFSDHLFGPAVLLAAFTAAWPHPLAGFNLIVLSTFVLSGWATWFVFRRRGMPALPAFLAGAMFAFSPYRWEHLGHLSLLLAGLIPLVLWSFDRLLAAPGWRRAGLFLLFYGLHLSGGCYYAYMIHVPLLALLASHLLPAGGRSGVPRSALRVLLPTALVAAALSAAAFLPYLEAARDQGQSRHDKEIVSYGATALSFLTPSSRNLYSGIWPVHETRYENCLFAGLLPTALLAVAAVLGWRRSRRDPALPASRRFVLGALLGVAVLGYLWGDAQTWLPLLAGRPPSRPSYRLAVLLLAGGLAGWALLVRRWTGAWPLKSMQRWERGLLLSGAACFLLAHPFVYLPLARVVPGLHGMRVPARFDAFLSLSVAWFAARAAAALCARLKRPRDRRLAAALLTAALLVELAPRTFVWDPLPEERGFPAVYRWLKGQPDVHALLELPFHDESTDIRYMYFWTLHWKPLVNGYSGYIPEDYRELQRRCCSPVPDPDLLAGLRAEGVSHLLLHTWVIPERWQQKEVWRWARRNGAEVVYADGEAQVFRLALPGRP